MRVDEALDIINHELIAPVGWEVSASDHTDRFESCICVHFTLTDAPDYSREFAPDYAMRVEGGAVSHWPLVIEDVADADALVVKVIDLAIENISHELREAFRLRPDYRAPAHPHRVDGIYTWAEAHGRDPFLDLVFGVA